MANNPETNSSFSEQFKIESKFCEKGENFCAYYTADFAILNQVYFELNILEDRINYNGKYRQNKRVQTIYPSRSIIQRSEFQISKNEIKESNHMHYMMGGMASNEVFYNSNDY